MESMLELIKFRYEITASRFHIIVHASTIRTNWNCSEMQRPELIIKNTNYHKENPFSHFLVSYDYKIKEDILRTTYSFADLC